MEPCAPPSTVLALVVALVAALLLCAWLIGVAWNLWQVLRAREHRAEVERIARDEVVRRLATRQPGRATVGFRPPRDPC